MLGCIVSNCGTQASKTVFRQISTHYSQSDHRVQIGQAGRSKMTTPPPTRTNSRASLARLQNQTKDSDSIQCAGTPYFQQFPQYSVHALCIN